MGTESPILARITLYKNSTLPMRAYVFREGLNEGFEGLLANAQAHFREVTSSMGKDTGFDYLLAAIWFNPVLKARTIDFMGYSGIRKSGKWGYNPEADPFIFRNGVFVSRDEKTLGDLQPGKNSFCGTTLRILGREEDYRLTTRNMGEYFGHNSHLGDLEPPISVGD